jgi:hypothetical protein
MKSSFSQNLNNRFIEETTAKDLLDVAVIWIGDTLAPEDVFSEDQLQEWAEDYGYTLDTDEE